MPTNILMPALSPTMEKGNLARWLKKEGDKIKSGDIIAEIETDKATMEYEAVDEGTLAKIVVPEGTQDVAVNAVIAVLAGEGEDVKAAAAGAKSAPAPKPPDKKLSQFPPHPNPLPNGEREQAPLSRRHRALHLSPVGRGRRRRRRVRGVLLLGETASSPRRSRAVSRKKPASISPAFRVPARMAA